MRPNAVTTDSLAARSRYTARARAIAAGSADRTAFVSAFAAFLYVSVTSDRSNMSDTLSIEIEIERRTAVMSAGGSNSEGIADNLNYS